MGDMFKGGGEATRGAVSEFSNINLPDIEKMKLELEDMVLQGILTPEQAQTMLVDSTAMEGITLDPKLKQSQMDALAALQDISSSGGMTLKDKANLSKISNEEMAQQRGQREAILQNAQARGLGGSGLELMSQLQNQQSSASRQSQRDLDVAAMAQDRALQALMQGGQMAGQIGAQDFEQQAQKAKSKDAIAQFNAQNQNQMNQFNTNAKNAAQLANLQNKQKVADTNVAQRNMQQQYNKELAQKQFNNQMTKAGGKSGALANLGQQQDAEKQANMQLIGGIAGAAMMSDMNVKEGVHDAEFDVQKFLDELVPKKYSYKNPKHGQGERLGVMAQDVEKSPMGNKMVEETSEGKAIDINKSVSAILASLGQINDRVKKIEGM